MPTPKAPQRRAGRIVDWNDERGFGFIEADGMRRFFHISDVERRDLRPALGMRVRFVPAVSRDKPAAVEVQLEPSGRSMPAQVQSAPRPTKGLDGRLLAAGLFAAGIALGTVFGRLPLEVAAFYLGMGIVSLVAYWRDKRAAERDRWRTPEATLHGIDLCCGIVGGLVAQRLLRHKTRKQEFVVVTAGIATLHALALIAWITPLRELLFSR
jgi:uncharacterized membrane protein YsdA (DUF1294 family)/cold shock CspA family protein